MSSNTSGEGDIRKNIVEENIVDCMIALPAQLFYNTMIPACLWFIARDNKNHKFSDRRGKVLFIDARKMGFLVDRRHKELTDDEIRKITDTYHAWRGEGGEYEDILGFCKSATLDEINKHKHVLTPGRYVGIEEEEDDGIPFDEKMKKLTSELAEQFKESEGLEEKIRKNLEKVGYGL
ncbi:N-6 DNA methylase, partial [Patescibacteria group bacterium]|nr:N-6 DNA methylase [Patescibacteria group bacterium]